VNNKRHGAASIPAWLMIREADLIWSAILEEKVK
jgi:hypothetical protein